MLSKIFLKVSKAGNTYGNIQDREEAHSQTCQFGMSLLYNVESKEKRRNVPYPSKWQYIYLSFKWQYKKVEIFFKNFIHLFAFYRYEGSNSVAVLLENIQHC